MLEHLIYVRVAKGQPVVYRVVSLLFQRFRADIGLGFSVFSKARHGTELEHMVPSAQDLRRAYRRAAMRSHPDRRQNHGREEDAKRRFQDVRDAFEFLQSGGAPMMSDMF